MEEQKEIDNIIFEVLLSSTEQMIQVLRIGRDSWQKPCVTLN